MAHSNIYVVTQDKRLVVIDTGTPGNAKKILAFIQEIGHEPQDVTTIILTHSHLDHIGSLKELKDLTGAKVASSEEEADVISGKKTIKPKKFLMRLAPLLIKAQAVDVDIALKNGDKIENFTVVSTPGHTPGSIMLYDMERKALFSGDSLRLENGKISTGPKQYSWDQEKEKDSIRKVSELDFNLLLPGHGDYLKENASTAVREYAKNN
jgi:glyoxylase-like metal-dependent hydrolase (beta-lactamase superfamily II)